MSVAKKAKPAKPTLFTIGHSTRTLQEFIEVLKAHGIRAVGDVRTVPRSRRVPQFNADTLKPELAKHRIRYVPMPALGGLRKPRADSPNAAWRNASFRGYADYMQTPEFAAAIDRLIEIAAGRPTAVMCAEAVPWRCHRSLIGDAMLVRGWQVMDLMTAKSAKPHKRTSFARVRGKRITYPPEAIKEETPVISPATSARKTRSRSRPSGRATAGSSRTGAARP